MRGRPSRTPWTPRRDARKDVVVMFQETLLFYTLQVWDDLRCLHGSIARILMEKHQNSTVHCSVWFWRCGFSNLGIVHLGWRLGAPSLICHHFTNDHLEAKSTIVRPKNIISIPIMLPVFPHTPIIPMGDCQRSHVPMSCNSRCYFAGCCRAGHALSWDHEYAGSWENWFHQDFWRQHFKYHCWLDTIGLYYYIYIYLYNYVYIYIYTTIYIYILPG